MIELLVEVGFTDVRITDRFDCFRDTSKEDVAKELAVRGVNLFARRGGIDRRSNPPDDGSY